MYEQINKINRSGSGSMVDLVVNVRANKKAQATLQKFQESLVLNLK